jgi:two-component system sensor histidine kinase ChvG
MRRVRLRRRLLLATLVLTALPLFFLACAWAYEVYLADAYRVQLDRVARALGQGRDEEVAREMDCEVHLLDPAGRVVWDSHTEARAIHPSFIGGFTEWIVERILPGDPPPESWEQIAPIVARFETGEELHRTLAAADHTHAIVTATGQSLVLLSVTPRQGGAALVVKVSRRGLRRLLAVHHDLAKLMLFQIALALGFALVLGRWMVRPLEKLTDAALAYPVRPITDLGARDDEFGELARSYAALADALEQRRRVTAEIGADIAHEFKNPLATIAAAGELLVSVREPDAARRALIAEQIGASVKRLRGAIDRMLGLLRLEVELYTEKPERVDYRRLVEELVASYRADPRCGGWRFVVDVEDSARDVALMPGRWQELLRNLLDNALVQPATHREIIVRAVRVDGQHVTLVRDHGPGVSDGNRDKIFLRFFTQRPASAAPGTGLGLSIVAAIAAAHGGTVRLDVTDGEGAQLRVSVPSRATS